MRFTALLLLAAAAGSGYGQASDLSGAWQGNAEATSRRNADGSVDILSSRPFSLALTTDGERVTGTWNEASFTWNLAGTRRGDAFDLTTPWQAAPGDDAGTQRFRWVITGARREGRLEGTRYLDVEGRQREPVLLKWTAERRGNVAGSPGH